MNTDDLIRISPPNSPEAERSVLGAILQDERAVLAAVSTLIVSDFYTAEHREIFDAVRYLDKKPVDVMTVSNELTRRGTLEGIGGSAYLLSLCRNVPTTANVGAYIEIVKEKAKLRALITSCRKAEEACYTQLSEVDVIAEELREGLRTLERDGEDDIVRAAEVAADTYEYIERRARGEDVTLKTGIHDLDRMTGGLMPGEIFVIGARPSVGKSAFGMEIGLNVTAQKKKVLILSREMQKKQYGLRVGANLSGISMSQLKDGAIGDQQWEPLADAFNEFSNRHMAFMFNTATVEKLRTKARNEKEKNGLDLIIVDYLQLVETMQKVDARYREVGIILRVLKEIAMTLELPVIALAQVARRKDNHCPDLQELRESGDIEQDADLVLFLHRPEDADDPDMPTYDKQAYMSITAAGREYLIAKLAKQRNGARGTFGLDFDASHMILRRVDSNG